MTAKSSRVEILVSNIQAAIEILTKEHDFVVTPVHSFDSMGFHIKFAVLSEGDQQFTLVEPVSGFLKHLLQEKGECTTYRLICLEGITGKSDFEIISGGISNSNSLDSPDFMQTALSTALSKLEFSRGKRNTRRRSR